MMACFLRQGVGEAGVGLRQPTAHSLAAPGGQAVLAGERPLSCAGHLPTPTCSHCHEEGQRAL